jgi:hypothetical protein
MDRATSGFALAAAITILFNTVLAIVKDSSKPLNTFMASLTGHQWTTHGLADLALFVGLGLLFTKTRAGEMIEPDRVIRHLIASVALSGFGLAAWYTFF